MKNLTTISLFFILLQTICSPILNAQDIDQIVKSEWVKVNGGLDFSTINYVSKGLTPRRDPFALYANGNINVTIKNFSFPFSVSYTNRDLSFTRPYNRFQFAPKYKWIQVYLKDHSMTFSKYNLNGANINGAGLVLTPKKWKIGLTYGNLAEVHNIIGTSELPSYKRKGLGVQTEFKKGKTLIGLHYFGGFDQINTLSEEAKVLSPLPQESHTFSSKWNATLLKKLALNSEIGYTTVYRDISTTETRAQTKEQFAAYTIGLKLPIKKSSLGLKYERVNPGYTTLGAYFFNDDFENFTVNLQSAIFQGKLNIGIEGGVEKNNLENKELSATQRWVANLNASAQLGKRLNISAAYSNFTNFTNVRPTTSPFFNEDIDTLNYFQVNQQWQFTGQYALSKSQSLSLTASSQVTEDGGTLSETQSTGTFNYQLSGGYNQSIKSKQLRYSVLANTFQSAFGNTVTSNSGPTVSVSKSWFKNQLRGTLSNSYYFSSVRDSATGEDQRKTQVNTLRFSFSFQTKVKAKRKSFSELLEDRKNKKANKGQTIKGDNKELLKTDNQKKSTNKKDNSVPNPNLEDKTKQKKKITISERHRLSLTGIWNHRTQEDNTPTANTSASINQSLINEIQELTITLRYSYAF